MPFYLFPDIGINIAKVFGLGAFSFIIAILWTPFLTYYLYRYKMWKKEERKVALDGKPLEYIQKFHEQGERHVPRLGGLLVWMTTFFIAFVFLFLDLASNHPLFAKLNFLSRGQTWIPLFTLVSASLVGLIDDVVQIKGKWKYLRGGLPLEIRVLLVILIGVVGGWWFYEKLGWSTILIPFIGEIDIGILYPLLFILTILATYSGGIIDGLDGLAGGTFASLFGAFGIIAFFGGQVDLATFCAVVLGSLLAFLWFNIPPARFYLGETGIMGIATTVGVLAFLTKSVVVLPIIGFLPMMTSASVILQLLSKKFRKKKLFLASPLHHHFEAMGWPHYKITMRYWIIGAFMASIGVVLRLIG